MNRTNIFTTPRELYEMNEDYYPVLITPSYTNRFIKYSLWTFALKLEWRDEGKQNHQRQLITVVTGNICVIKQL